ncbi:MAG: tRNA lysidine(34) synthetase TilS [Chloroflexi bacterium]|nr:tRNA lysidine(34) synthetase TilS [Chloroflexota bacterium]
MGLARRVQLCLAQALTSGLPGRLVVGVSGGADSLALLHSLAYHAPAYDLVVAHLNHGWRDTAVSDAQFVAQTAAAWGLPCVVETADVIAQASAGGQSLEEAGRLARYRFFASVARETGAAAVLVAHNADDQAETVLLNLLRGTGLTGLGGMKSVAPLPEAPEFWLLRPLLTTSRADIEAYCQEHGLTPVQDSTNSDITFLRNRIRHHLLPELTTYNPQIQTHLQQLAHIVAADEDYLEQVVAEHWPALAPAQSGAWLALDRARWLALPLAMRRRSLRRAVATVRPSITDLSFATIEQARLVAEAGAVGAQSDLPDGVRLRVDYGRLLITTPVQRQPGDWPQLPAGAVLPLPVPGILPLANGWRLETTLLDSVDAAYVQNNADPWLAFLAADTPPLWVRGRRPGERFAPLGMNGRTTSLKKVMINRHIGAAWRNDWPLVCTAQHIVWLVGHQIDERAKITPASRGVFQIRCAKG